jgi:hypothetical protein
VGPRLKMLGEIAKATPAKVMDTFTSVLHGTILQPCAD